MKILSSLLIISVSLCNIALNMRVQKIALLLNQTSSLNYYQVFIAFIIGSLSMVSMFFLYKNPEINLARGIAWMGAISILGGSVYGIAIRKNKIDIEEKILIICLFLLFIYRIFIKD